MTWDLNPLPQTSTEPILQTMLASAWCWNPVNQRFISRSLFANKEAGTPNPEFALCGLFFLACLRFCMKWPAQALAHPQVQSGPRLSLHASALCR